MRPPSSEWLDGAPSTDLMVLMGPPCGNFRDPGVERMAPPCENKTWKQM